MTSIGFDAATGRALARQGPPDPRGIVLLLHGGKPRDPGPVPPRSASVWRMQAMRDAVAPALARHGLASWLLRYDARGWNGGAPVADARWALDRAREEHPGLPVVLLGHSMGARTGARVADDPAVRGLVALAPWFDSADPVAPLAGKSLVAAHGRRDRITSARMTRAFVVRAGEAGADARFVDMGLTGHYLLHGSRRWARLARDAVLTMASAEPA
ncbi:alpha/beta fold hydrolase [Nocardioides sambongensis]|uniref:alpha/beta fold hydrolase n=1 Tax=Nocardioides sambongensis TaxID=2589074 RepID=UPI0018C89B8B|nr:alpha/beta fold hydrolase [Nocardioides sambongensis]